MFVGGRHGQYAYGKPPTVWEGSKDIFRSRLNAGWPVKHGQCWMFAGVLTIVRRLLRTGSERDA